MTSQDQGPVLVFGAAGQDGHYLRELHQRRGERVLAFSIPAAPGVSALDIGDTAAVGELIRREQPSIVYQLAAISTTRHDALWANHAAISTGTLNVLEAAWQHSRHTRVVVIGSALQFQNRGDPIHETDPFEARDAYSVSRIHTVYAARYFRSLGLRAYVAYLFHHESPLRLPPHVSARICQDVVAIEHGEKQILEIGDLSVEKEWGFAGDVAEAIAMLASQEAAFEAVIGTGRAYSIGEWARRCFSHAGLSAKDRVRQMEGFSAEYQRVVSRPTTMQQLGWAPKVDLDTLVDQMMRAARRRV